MRRVFRTLLLIALVAVAAPAGATPKFGPLPRMGKADKSDLKIRVVQYTGSTNGGMIVEVRNDGDKPQTFKAEGLYFVPNGDPERAPQRLGAAGPFEQQVNNDWRNRENLSIAPNQKVKLKLQVFCIDSHRASPSSATGFKIAKKRLPKELRAEIEGGTRDILRKSKVRNAKRAKSAVQSHVWNTRNKKWIKLQGERKDEKSVKRPQQRRRIHRRRLKSKPF